MRLISGSNGVRPALKILLGLSLVLQACQGQSDQEAAAEALQRGLEAHRADDLDTAEEEYQEVLEIQPRNKHALYNLGLINQTRGDGQGAEAFYRRALNVDPDFVPVLFNLAILRTEAGAREEAVDLYRRVTDLAPDNAGAYLNLGLLLRDMGRTREAARELETAVELDPSLESRADLSDSDS